MIKTFLTILIALCFMFSCSNGDNGLTIEGEISNLSSPYVIASFNLNDTVHVDTISVNEKGEFSYFQNIDTATIFTFYFNDFNSSAIVFSEKGINKIKMKGDALLPVLIEVKGGEINEDLTIFKKENGTLLKQRTFLMTKIDHEVDSLMNSGNLISEKERVAQINSLNHELVQKVEDFIISNPDKISSVILINEFFKNNDNPQSLKRVLDYLENDALNSSLANRLKTHNQKMMLSAEGTHMPYFKLKDNKDKTIQSSDFENKYLLISFLSSNGDK